MAEDSKKSTKKSGIGSHIRITLAIVSSLMMASFMLLWDGGHIPLSETAPWTGSIIFLPILAMIVGLAANSTIQQMSCGTINWPGQFKQIAVIPIPYLIMAGLLYMLPILRWPIEGMIQSSTPQMKMSISSAFYIFWISMYTQSFMTGISQICPE
jgi:hypothetical protein